MLIGRLKDKPIGVDILIQHRPVWRFCFDWLGKISENIRPGTYNLDCNIVTAECYEYSTTSSLGGEFKRPDSIVQIHYIVEGLEKFSYLPVENRSDGKEDVYKKEETISQETNITRGRGEFIVVFHDGPKYYNLKSIGAKTVKRILVSIPIQRIL